jgi:hypothetical protein
MARVPIINELLAAAVQTGEGVEATPVTADIMQVISFELSPNQEQLEREDKGFGRSSFGFARGGNQAATWELVAHLLVAPAAAPVVAPNADRLLQAAFGATPVSINTTVQAAPAPTTTVFAVGAGVGATLQVGDVLAVLIGTTYQMRPITAIATDTLTFSPAFTAAPASGATVKARIYRLATAPTYLTLVGWERDTAGVNTGFSRKALDALVNELIVDMNQSIVQLTARGPASRVNRTSIPAIPTLPTFDNLAQARNFGGVWIDTTSIKAYELQLTLGNGAVALPVPLGSEFADGSVMGRRSVVYNLLLDAETVTNLPFVTDSEDKTKRKLFGHIGDDHGRMFGFNMPVSQLALSEYEKGAETLRCRFTPSKASATVSNNELFIAIA